MHARWRTCPTTSDSQHAPSPPLPSLPASSQSAYRVSMSSVYASTCPRGTSLAAPASTLPGCSTRSDAPVAVKNRQSASRRCGLASSPTCDYINSHKVVLVHGSGRNGGRAYEQGRAYSVIRHDSVTRACGRVICLITRPASRHAVCHASYRKFTGFTSLPSHRNARVEAHGQQMAQEPHIRRRQRPRSLCVRAQQDSTVNLAVPS